MDGGSQGEIRESTTDLDKGRFREAGRWDVILCPCLIPPEERADPSGPQTPQFYPSQVPGNNKRPGGVVQVPLRPLPKKKRVLVPMPVEDLDESLVRRKSDAWKRADTRRSVEAARRARADWEVVMRVEVVQRPLASPSDSSQVLWQKGKRGPLPEERQVKSQVSDILSVMNLISFAGPADKGERVGVITFQFRLLDLGDR